MYFRNRDYRNKNRIKQVENYLPLRDKVENIIEYVNIISKNGEMNLYCILDGKMGASYAREVRLFEVSLEELQDHFSNGTYKIQDDYKLFKSHRKVKKKVWELYQYCQKRADNSNVSNLNDFLEDLEELVYRIKYYEAKIMIGNFFCRTLECFSIWINHKKKN